MHRHDGSASEKSAELNRVTDLFEEDVYEAIDLDVCVKKRTVKGGPSPECVLREIEALEKALG